MLTNGGTRGAVSGRDYNWKPNQVITGPEGEFRHLKKGAFKIETATSKRKQEHAVGGSAGNPNPPSVPPINATDSAIALAAEHGIDLTNLVGSGADGRITQPDVKALLKPAE